MRPFCSSICLVPSLRLWSRESQLPVPLQPPSGRQYSADITPPGGITEALQTLLFNVVTNPVKALMDANYIGILAWAIGLGIAMRHANESTKPLITDLSHGVSTNIVKAVIAAPRSVFWVWWPRPWPRPASTRCLAMPNCWWC
ncbi:hypothetical protein ACLK12_16425 [Escherichia coli]